MLAFEVAGGREAGRAVIDALRLPELTASLGSVHTMVVHPPSTSQRQMTEAELLAAGITPGLLRVSVGLEDLEDLQDDLDGGPRRRPRRSRPGAPAPSRGPAIATPDASAAASRPPAANPSPGSGTGCGGCSRRSTSRSPRSSSWRCWRSSG